MNQETVKDWKWSDRFIPEIRRVLTENAHKVIQIDVAGPTADMKEATDFQITTKLGSVAARVRRNCYSWRDWTIRYSRPSGVETEYHKIMQGHADFYLYAWADTTDSKFADWILVDMALVRMNNALCRGQIKNNRDGTRFLAIQARQIADCLLGNSMGIENIPDDPHWFNENEVPPEYDEARFIIGGPQPAFYF